MSDLDARAARFTSKRAFELLLILAAVFESAHLLGLFGRRAEVDGRGMALAFTIAIPWVPVLLALLVTRRGSTIAKWLLVVLVAIAVLTAIRIGTGRWGEPAILLGAIAGACQLAAVAILLTTGRNWTRSNRIRS